MISVALNRINTFFELVWESSRLPIPVSLWYQQGRFLRYLGHSFNGNVPPLLHRHIPRASGALRWELTSSNPGLDLFHLWDPARNLGLPIDSQAGVTMTPESVIFSTSSTFTTWTSIPSSPLVYPGKKRKNRAGADRPGASRDRGHAVGKDLSCPGTEVFEDCGLGYEDPDGAGDEKSGNQTGQDVDRKVFEEGLSSDMM